MRIRPDAVRSTHLVIAGVVVLLLARTIASATVRPAALFQDHAVLPCDHPLDIWGLAEPGEEICVSFRDQVANGRADPAGRWRLTLAAFPPDATPATLRIVGSNTVEYRDVVTGDLWLASGQSNMHWLLRNTQDADLVVPAAIQPAVRHFRVERTVADQASTELTGTWTPTTPAHAGEFSAVAHHFAVTVHQLTGRPIGVINATWGGTPIESWLPSTLWTEPEFSIVPDRWQQQLAAYPDALRRWEQARDTWTSEQAGALAAGRDFDRRRPSPPPGPGSPYAPSVLFNGMISPLLPTSLRGVLWYQGEANTHRPAEYAALFKRLIHEWRRGFRRDDLPFYWVQLSAFADAESQQSTDWAALREAQSEALILPSTGQAISIDVGDTSNVHPRNKREIGRRLARIALRRDYGLEIRDTGPKPTAATWSADKLTITFHTPGRLVSSAAIVRGFELSNEVGEFTAMPARITGPRTVSLSVDDSSGRATLRYAWGHAPEASLHDDAGLPVAPFELDVFPK